VFQAIGRLRKEARDEIDRLIGFLDKTDDCVSREVEENGDELDASYPERGPHVLANPAEDDEDDDPVEDGDPAEPSLGSGAVYELRTQEGWAAGGTKDLEGEHDGAEPEDEHGDDADDEPALGWTVDGAPGNTDDRELRDHR
jgi:hypothetical protein